MNARPALSVPALATLAAALVLGACYNPRTDDPVMKTWEQNQWDSLYKLVDENADGKVTPEEFQRNYVNVTWKYFDRDGNGYITVEEWFLDGRSPERDQWFKDLDANGDGRISRDEFEAARTEEGAKAFFELMDKDGSGAITRDDLKRT